MRIQAGQHRGRWFKSVDKELPVKPISARIKKSLFDILRPRLGGAFLDLYAGTGAVGLEALSRGAEFAFFVDKDKRCLAVIDENLKRLGFAAKGRTAWGDILADLSWVGYRSGRERYDIVFLGPPYRTEDNTPLQFSTPSLGRVAEAKLLAPGGWAVVQHHLKEKVETPPGLAHFRQEKYGDTLVDFYQLS
jgi:16S rRNA (guanine966-N2)-methyltransferase